MPAHIHGCEFILARSLSTVARHRVRGPAEAHLWRFAAIQKADGTFPRERYGTGFSDIGILEAVSRYDHPAAEIMLVKALPGLVAAQRDDASWGSAAETEAAVRILRHPRLPKLL